MTTHNCPICGDPVARSRKPTICCSQSCGIAWGWQVRRKRERQREADRRFKRTRT